MRRTGNCPTEDIIFSFPLCVGGEWIIQHVWIYIRGRGVSYSICDSDGNHEPATKREVDLQSEKHDSDWVRYSRHVLETGEDPLHEFTIKRQTLVRRNIVAVFAPSPGSDAMVLEYVVVGGRTLLASERETIPKAVLEFLELDLTDEAVLAAPWCSTYEAAREYAACAGCVGRTADGVYIKARVEWKVARNPKIVARELKKAAKRHIERYETRQSNG